MRIRSHLGTSFEVWSGRRAWFWFVSDPRGDGASIGAATNETEAICEAHSSIEEMATRHSSTAVSLGMRKPAARGTHGCNRASPTAMGWNELLESLNRYLPRFRTEDV